MYKLCLLATCLLFACKSTQYTPQNYDKAILVFGSGGGFTGGVKEYTILENGQIFTNTKEKGVLNELSRLPKKQVKQIFENYDVLDIASMNYDAPGNEYFYIEYTESGEKHKILWGDRGTKVPESLNVYFKNLKRFVKLNG